MKQLLIARWFLAVIIGFDNTIAYTQTHTEDALTLKTIMADPDWIGPSPKQTYWSHDDQHIVFSKKAIGHSHDKHYRLNIASGETTLLTDSDALWHASHTAKANDANTLGLFSFQNDIYLSDFESGKIIALTKDEAKQSNPQFIDDNTVSYLRGRQIFVHHLDTRLSEQIADFKETADPNKKGEDNYLQQNQPRLLEYIAITEKEKAFQKQRQQDNRLSRNKTWYLGTKKTIRTFSLSPDANWLLLGTTAKNLKGQPDNMPEFVTANGYVNNREVRALVGTPKPIAESFTLYDLKNHKHYPIDITNLPGIKKDPLKTLKEKAEKNGNYSYQEKDKPRAVYTSNFTRAPSVIWADDSQQFALRLYSYDNKDRWIVSLDVENKKLTTLHRLTNNAWVNDWTFNQFGWLPDNETLFYLSEQDGYSHLYLKKGNRRAKQMTKGQFEVSNLTLTKDSHYIYFKANIEHPGVYEIYRIALENSNVEAITQLAGMNDYLLSPDEDQLIVRHSTTTQPPELYLQATTLNSPAKKLTFSTSDAFQQYDWQAPQIIGIPSSHTDQPIYSRYYPARSDQNLGGNKKRPAVIFVHGAGYLQNAHQGWSGYFREYMFHNMLTEQGYVVLDMDYRASKGYGRDWRTAIYRQMGTPELEDLIDGTQWLTENADVDPNRIGIYGGSYGGFMTFMALFNAPDVFAAGAALRPVTDWAHYNHSYTSNILNTPDIDPEAYERSSPIEFAEGLSKPLLICHGMIDDNVFFKDSVRLVQRLIELEKTSLFETAIYPVEPHGFKQASSWLDEYTRIHQLFEEHLN